MEQEREATRVETARREQDRLEEKQEVLRGLWASKLETWETFRTSTPNSFVMSIFSMKVNLGKTFLTANLATAIAQVTGQDTAVVALDVNMGDLFTYFGREPSASIDDLMELGEGAARDRIREVGVEVAPHTWAFGVPPVATAEAPADEPVGKFLRSIRNEFPFAIVDSDGSMANFVLSDLICLVTPLEPGGLMHLAEAFDSLVSAGISRDRLRLVVNRPDRYNLEVAVAEAEEELQTAVVGQVPASSLVEESHRQGKPIVLEQPASDVALCIASLARSLVNISGTTARG